jgi:uncharacterized protein (DUF433 family)
MSESSRGVLPAQPSPSGGSFAVVERRPPLRIPASRSHADPRIVVDPAICGGQPVIRGTRLAVAMLADSLQEGATPAQLLQLFPQLQPADLQAVLLYAARRSP